MGLGLLLLGACSATPYPGGIQSPDVSVRCRAIKLAGERRDRNALPALVERLEDEDEAVRFYTILALEKITGTRLGYDYAQSAAERGRAVKRWQNYLRTTPGPASQPTSSRATARRDNP